VGLSDVAGIFSRYFIVGFFLPSFTALVVYSVSVSNELLPNIYERYGPGAQTAILGGAGLLLGLLLLGLNYHIIRLFEGYPLQALVHWLESPRRHKRWRRLAKPARGLHDWLVANQNRRRQALREIRNGDSNPTEQGRAAWRLDRRFPRKKSQLLPTSFGNSIRAFETHSSRRYGLDAIAAAPRIDGLMCEKEHEIMADAKAEVAFFVNLALLTALLGIAYLVDEAVAQPVSWYATLVYLLPFLVAYASYRAAVGAARRWGSTVRAALDLHRLELYEKIGLKEPESFSEEREVIGPALSRTLLHGKRLPDDLRAPREPADEAKGGEK